MPTLGRPGTYATEVLPTQIAGYSGAGIINTIMVGANNRGPTSPQYVASWTDYVSWFGAWGTLPTGIGSLPGTTNPSCALSFAAYMFFGSGGQGMYAQRVAGAGAVAATRTLTDGAGTPVATLKVTAQNPGAWGNSIFIDITAGSATGRFDLIVHVGDATPSTIVERWADLSIQPTDPRYAPALVNNTSAQFGGTQGSRYVVLQDMGSVTAAPNNAPSVQAGTALATGADGSAVASADYQSALAKLDTLDEPLTLLMPAVSDATTVNYATNYGSTRGDVFVIIDPLPNRTASQVISDSSGLTATGYAAIYSPWITVLDPSVATTGVTRSLPPGGSVAGVYATTDRNIGVFKTPAGVDARLSGVIALETKFSNTELDNLNLATIPVNAIRQVPGGSLSIMGGRTLLQSRPDRYIANRRTLIFCKSTIKQLTTFAIFQPNTQNLWNEITAVVGDFLTQLWQSNGLVGSSQAEAFYVVCDATTNTPATIQNGQVNFQVGLSLDYPAEYVVLTIGQSNGAASITESTS